MMSHAQTIPEKVTSKKTRPEDWGLKYGISQDGYTLIYRNIHARQIESLRVTWSKSEEIMEDLKKEVAVNGYTQTLKKYKAGYEAHKPTLSVGYHLLVHILLTNGY